MKYISAFVLCFVFAATAFAGEEPKALPTYVVTKVEKDPSLKQGETAFTFQFFTRFKTSPTIKNDEILFSYNGQNQKAVTTENGTIHLQLKSDLYKFQFYYNESYSEVYTDSIKGKSGQRSFVSVYFDYSHIRNLAEKPVIYLYPEKPTEVKVQLTLKGDLTFTYPAYKDSWQVTANPGGTITQGDKTYGYLFWEGNIPELNKPMEVCKGTVVVRERLLQFLENTLAEAGLNTSETQDFITYWYPRMAQYPVTTIQFLVNATFDAYAHLDISPQPDKVLRLFMLWSPGRNDCHALHYPGPFPAFERKGFTVVEWGGMQLPEIEKK